ncbi:ATP-binding protein [Cytophagaceae bacterium DM2B3-1]|uniref:histidine kinase n=1 Tax=Xanthocytophaga flava TaxID=3048013 RepID=A0ABT7CEI4_9BACT|nr:ATP-binding protein [Xanthocytophaga flavus]MDJ1468898.1 ATP-binding protein [Xanthocytophaga flavus]MDJ1492072.1 ATP-binding protein [Xanthocytophaga flavus]
MTLMHSSEDVLKLYQNIEYSKVHEVSHPSYIQTLRNEITNLEQERLLVIIDQLKQENEYLKYLQHQRTNQLIACMEGIILGEKSAFQLQEISEEDPFFVLFEAVRLLQGNIKTIWDEQKSLAEEHRRIREKSQREVETQKIHLNAILENSDTAIGVIDKEGMVVEYNEQMNKLFTTMDIQLEYGESVLACIPDPLKPIWSTRISDALQGKATTYEDHFSCRNHNLVYEIKFFPIYKDSEVLGSSIFLRNITQTVKASQRLHIQQAELQKVKQELNRFVYSSSHDLRSPLTSLLGLIAVAKDEKSRDEVTHYLEMMEKSVLKLDGFVREIIDYSKNSNLEIVSEKIQFDTLISEIFDGVEHMDNADKIRKDINISEEECFFSDRRRLKMVFNNLVSNAIRYSYLRRKNPFIKININVSKEKARIEVTDNGQGIYPQHLDRIFDMFYRATQTNAGPGLGLYIVKESIQKLGGNIKVESVVGEGTTFFLEIPNLCPCSEN